MFRPRLFGFFKQEQKREYTGVTKIAYDYERKLAVVYTQTDSYTVSQIERIYFSDDVELDKGSYVAFFTMLYFKTPVTARALGTTLYIEH